MIMKAISSSSLKSQGFGIPRIEQANGIEWWIIGMDGVRIRVDLMWSTVSIRPGNTVPGLDSHS